MLLQWSVLAFIVFFTSWRQQDKLSGIVGVYVSETILAPGKSRVVSIQVDVKEGYHIQANKVKDKSLIPATLEITPGSKLLTGKPVFPRHKLFRLEGTEDDLNVFDGKFEIKVSVKAPINTPSGNYVIKAKLRYQACDAKTCLFPRVIEFEIPVVVAKTK